VDDRAALLSSTLRPCLSSYVATLLLSSFAEVLVFLRSPFLSLVSTSLTRDQACGPHQAYVPCIPILSLPILQLQTLLYTFLSLARACRFQSTFLQASGNSPPRTVLPISHFVKAVRVRRQTIISHSCGVQRGYLLARGATLRTNSVTPWPATNLFNGQPYLSTQLLTSHTYACWPLAFTLLKPRTQLCHKF